MKLAIFAAVIVAFALLCWAAIFGASRVADRLQDRAMRRRAVRELEAKGLEQVLGEIDREIERLQHSAETSRRSAAETVGIGRSVSGGVQGCYQEMNWLSLYRKHVIAVAGERDQA